MKSIRTFTLAILIATIILFTICFLVIGWPMVDAKACIERTAEKIQVSPSYSSVQDYIIKSLHPGMTKVEVNETLEKIGPIIQRKDPIEPYNGVIYDQVVLKICRFSSNNIVILTDYDLEGHLLNVHINDYP